MANTEKKQLVEVGCLWKREAKSGIKYLKGMLNLKALGFDKDVAVIAFSNSKKLKENQPDIRVYLSDDKPPVAAPVAKAPAPKAVVKKAPEPEPEAAAGDNELL